jgi:DNA repair protein RadC
MIIELKAELAAREGSSSGEHLTNPGEVEACLGDLKDLAQEAFCTITLNTKNRLIKRHLVTLGTLNSTYVHPREVFRTAIQDSAAAIIIAHNHPSGDPSPSSDDLKITRRLIEAGRIIDINVLDHVIIGDTSVSLREAGLVEF